MVVFGQSLFLTPPHYVWLHPASSKALEFLAAIVQGQHSCWDEAAAARGCTAEATCDADILGTGLKQGRVTCVCLIMIPVSDKYTIISLRSFLSKWRSILAFDECPDKVQHKMIVYLSDR